MNEIRLLTADEIECRVAQVKKTKNGVGCSLLLYKDARCDMKILDEVFGIFGWQRKHQEIGGRLYCTLSIYDAENDRWIEKQDVGTESNTEKEKGQASDSFKRAGFCVGIGRELYTAPFIWVNLKEGEYYERGDKYGATAGFVVRKIEYVNREISHLVIADKRGEVRFEWGNQVHSSGTDDELLNAVNELKKLIFKLNGGDKEASKSYFMNQIGADATDIEKVKWHLEATKKQLERMSTDGN